MDLTGAGRTAFDRERRPSDGRVIEDNAGRQDETCSGHAGTVSATGATFQDSVFNLCNPASSLTGCDGNATVNLFAPVAIIDSELGSVYVAGHAGEVQLTSNVLSSGHVLVDG